MTALRTLAAALLLLALSPGHAQISSYVSTVTPEEAEPGRPVTFTAELQQSASIDRVFLLFRPFGEGQYRRVEMDVAGTRATVSLPASFVKSPFLEYYLVVRTRSGKLDGYPQSEGGNPLTSPPMNPRRLAVRDAGREESQIIFLSPEPSSVLPPEEVIISISLLRVDSLVVRRATQILLDGADVTPRTVVSGDLMVFVPDNTGMRLSPGVHKITVRLFNREGKAYKSVSQTFTVQGTGLTLASGPVVRAFTYNASLQLETRREDVTSVGTWYNRAGMQFTGRYQDWRFTSNIFLTSDEKSNRQPQNRYFVGAELPWMRIGLGDSYPEFPSLIMSGKRIRGITSGVHLGFFNLDIAYGSVARAVEGAELARFPGDSLVAEQQRDPSASFVPINDTTWGRFAYGSYARNLFAVRPSFGSGETWQVGFTWLASGDDKQSVRYGLRPQENIVLGTDFLARFDESRIELTGQAAFSAYNNDISSGDFTDAYIDSVYARDPETIKRVRNRLSPFITVNDNLRPLSLAKLSTFAAEVGLGLNYFDNAFRFTTLYRGNDYLSFGQTFLRTDIHGFNVVDRIRLLQSQLFATIGFERLQDNTSNTKDATTVYSNINVALSYYPLQHLPGVTVGFGRYVNDNSLPLDSLAVVSDATNRISLQSTYDFDFAARHTALLSVSSSRRDDRSPRQLDVNNTVLTLGLGTRYTIPLQTEISLAFNWNDLPDVTPGTSQQLNYASVCVQGKYTPVRDILILSGTILPTFGDFRRTTLDFSTEWFIRPAMSLTFQLSYFKNDGIQDDNFFSLRYRYDL